LSGLAVHELIKKMIRTTSTERPPIEEVVASLKSDQLQYDDLARISHDSLLGEGGFAVVYKKLYRGHPVAVKRIRRMEIHEMEIHEIESLFYLVHPNVVKMITWFDRHDYRSVYFLMFSLRFDLNFICRFLVMELCEGTLKDFIPEKMESLEIADDLNYLYQMACGVGYIHSRHLVHRDIKPSHVLVSKRDTNFLLKISGFGSSKHTTEAFSFSLSGMKGTMNYMAPEILTLSVRSEVLARCSLASDIFSLGCVFFYFITKGLHPFGDRFEIISNIVSGNAANLHSKNH
jgi:serine/threonine protein kinase